MKTSDKQIQYPVGKPNGSNSVKNPVDILKTRTIT